MAPSATTTRSDERATQGSSVVRARWTSIDVRAPARLTRRTRRLRCRARAVSGGRVRRVAGASSRSASASARSNAATLSGDQYRGRPGARGRARRSRPSRGGTTPAKLPPTPIAHLLVAWRATLLATIDPEDYYDFQVNRPHVGFTSDGDREISWRTTSLWHCQAGPDDRDVILITGIEPNLRWRSFCEELLDYVTSVGAGTFVTLGALLADVPHTRPVPITGISSDPDLAERHGLEPSRYVGADRHRRRAPGGSPAGAASPPCRTGRPCRTTSRSRPRRRPRWRCSVSWRIWSAPRSTSVRCPRRRRPGSAASTSWPPTTPTSPTTCARSRKSVTPPTCRGDAATPSPGVRALPHAAARRMDVPRRGSPGQSR